MKFSLIFIDTFWCTLYISKQSTAVELFENNTAIQPADDSFNVIIEENSETNTSDFQTEDKKLNSDESFNVIIEENSETNTSDMQRKGKKPKSKSTSVRNCHDLKIQGKRSGEYLITPCDDCPAKVVKVYCDMDTDEGGWTVIQRRDNFPEQQDFLNTWDEYSMGFGDVSKDFWLGNNNIHCLTKQSHNEIRFDLEDHDGNKRFAVYGFFYIHDETNKYKLNIQHYVGDAGDSMAYQNNMIFSTKDAENSHNCIARFKGAWWHNACHHSNLNGLYNSTAFGQGINWYHFKGHRYSMKMTEMKIRPKI